MGGLLSGKVKIGFYTRNFKDKLFNKKLNAQNSN
ncbi:Uncharacterised protein [Staphylococcus nepalensis]|nr:Uncharacterised protein [Staphylococcus nepalensis]SUM96037.1 Uncharacterised protein [Staphylococcus nepalensis]